MIFDGDVGKITFLLAFLLRNTYLVRLIVKKRVSLKLTAAAKAENKALNKVCFVVGYRLKNIIWLSNCQLRIYFWVNF